MRHASINIFVACAIALLVTACDLSTGYRGYGTFSDMGAGATTERYAVDFGPVDLGKASEKTFKMAGLPPVEFTMGLRPVKASTTCDAAAVNTVSVRIDVEIEDGAVVMAEEGPLSTWITSSDIIYRRGAEQQAPDAGNPPRHARTGELAAQGWGTSFTPQSTARYIVKFHVLAGTSAPHCESRLVLLSSGWK